MPKLTEEQKQKRAETRRKNKEIKEAKELAERKESQRLEKLDRARRFRDEEPRRTFKVGDEVVVLGTNWKNCKVVEVLDEGRTYKVSYIFTNNNYGNPKDHSEETYENWANLKLVGSKENKESFVKESFFNNIQFSNRQVSDILSKKYYFGLDLNPDYQRDYVWEEKDRVFLIDSMFKGLDIGKFVFIHRGYSDEFSYEVLDGKQRITTLLDFFNDKFKYKGYYYSELHPNDRRYLDRYLISVAETKEEMTQKDKYEYFLALNIGGVSQSQEQIEKVRKLLEECGKE